MRASSEGSLGRQCLGCEGAQELVVEGGGLFNFQDFVSTVCTYSHLIIELKNMWQAGAAQLLGITPASTPCGHPCGSMLERPGQLM